MELNAAAAGSIRMAHRDILAIGASAGGFEALRFLAGEFPPDLPASVFVVIHLSSQFRSTLDAIMTQAGLLSASFRGAMRSTASRRMDAARPRLRPSFETRIEIGCCRFRQY